MKKVNRRQALQWMGFTLALPMLEATLGELAFAAAARRRRFIGVYFPNGAYMPGGANGNWVYGPWSYRNGAANVSVPEGALSPLEAAGHRGNIMVLRGIINGGVGRPGQDQHFDGTAGFLSCGTPVVGDPTVAQCARSFDHYIGDLAPSLPMRTVALGWQYDLPFTVHPQSHSQRYLHSISWASPTVPASKIQSPLDFFNRILGPANEYNAGLAAQQAAYQQALAAFQAGEAAAQAAYQQALAQAADRRTALQYLWGKKKSVLDGVMGQINDVKRSLGSADRERIESYFTGMREIEVSLGQQMTTLIQQAENPPPPTPGVPPTPPSGQACPITPSPGTYITPELYFGHFRSMHRILVKAFQCDLVRSASIMYDNSVGQQNFGYNAFDPSATQYHHDASHYGTDVARIQSQHAINKIHTSLFSHLLSELKSVPGLLEDTLVLYGSDMSGDTHLFNNIPMLLAGAGSDLRFGEEIGNPAVARRLADLFVEMGRDVYGISSLTSFGAPGNASTGTPIGIAR